MTKWLDGAEEGRSRSQGALPGRLRAARDRRRRRRPARPRRRPQLDVALDGPRARPSSSCSADRAAPPRLPVGPRADRARRSCRTRSRRRTRSRTRRSPATTRSCSTSSATCSSRSYFLALLLEERGEGDLETVARGDPREARPPAPARVRRRRGATRRRACKANWERIKREQEGREGVFHDVPEALPGAALRAQGAAAGEGGRLRVPRRRRARSPTSTTSSELRELTAGSRARRSRRAPRSSATCCSPRSTSRGRLERRSRARAAARRSQRFRRRVEAAERLAAGERREIGARCRSSEQDRLLRPRQGDQE